MRKMVKRIGLLALVISLFLVLASPVAVQAVDRLTVLDSSVKAEFPIRLNFSLTAESNVKITDIRFHYSVDRVSFAQVVSEVILEFEPAVKVNAAGSLDMRRIGGLPPGAMVQYWWTVKDTSNSEVETNPAQIQFNDTRHTWNKLTEGKLTIYWYEGNTSFAGEIMTAAQQTLAKLAKDTGAQLEKPAEIYIYASSRDLQGAMIFPQEWTGGVTYNRYSTIAMGIPTSEVAWGKRATTHEFTHLVTNQVTLNPYNDPPTWFEEGMAMYAEGPMEPVFVTLFNRAKAENRLITVRSLASPFSANPEEAVLGYAESFSIMEFLITQYGQSKMLGLLNAFREGNSPDGALQKVYGFDMDGLNDLWQKWVKK